MLKLFIGVCLMCFISISRARAEVPQIIPNEADVTVSPGEGFNFTCLSSEPITWKFDEYWNKYDNSLKEFRIHHTLSQNADGLYESTLELPNIHDKYVAYYYCINNASTDVTQRLKDINIGKLMDNSQAAKIYLFVNDPENPIVESVTDEIFINKHESATIPCKPTSRNSTVELKKNGYWSVPERVITKNFNIYEGFLVEKATVNNDDGHYTCSSNGRTKEFYLSVRDLSRYVS